MVKLPSENYVISWSYIEHHRFLVLLLLWQQHFIQAHRLDGLKRNTMNKMIFQVQNYKLTGYIATWCKGLLL